MLREWSLLSLNLPSRNDYYLMSLNTSVLRLFHKSPTTIHLEHSRLEFTDGRNKPSAEEMKARIAVSKSAWATAAGGKATMRIIDEQGNVLREPVAKVRSTVFYGKLGYGGPNADARGGLPEPRPNTSPQRNRRVRGSRPLH